MSSRPPELPRESGTDPCPDWTYTQWPLRLAQYSSTGIAKTMSGSRPVATGPSRIVHVESSRSALHDLYASCQQCISPTICLANNMSCQQYISPTICISNNIYLVNNISRQQLMSWFIVVNNCFTPLIRLMYSSAQYNINYSVLYGISLSIYC